MGAPLRFIWGPDPPVKPPALPPPAPGVTARLPTAAFGGLMAFVQPLNTRLMLTDEYRAKILKKLEEDPQISQRDLARELGISLGKANYCLRALIQIGLIKANNFKNNRHKAAYMYFLTSKGIAEKARATTRFLDRKLAEYEALEREIETLRREITK